MDCRGLTGMLLALLLAAGCTGLQEDECDRHSDCDGGRCCVNGECVFQDEMYCPDHAGDSDSDSDVDTDSDLDTDADTDLCDPDAEQLCPVAVIGLTDPLSDEVKPLDTGVLDGSASNSPLGKNIRYRWYFSQAPPDSHTGFRPESNPGATRTTESGSTSAQPTFFADLAGVYRICLEVCQLNGDGSVDRCSSDACCGGDACMMVGAVPREAIHVALVWEQPETDVDLHYIHAGATYGDREIDKPDGDCHFFNPHPDYCASGDDSDDPSLDIDDVRGYGPENINHDNPCDGEYRIWVSYYEDKGMGSTRAKLRVFIKGVQVAETSHILDRRNCHWLAGKVVWSGDSGSFEPADPSDDYICGQNNPEQ